MKTIADIYLSYVFYCIFQNSNYVIAELHGCMWEMDDNVTNCRQCDVVFSMLTRKHHCRHCGGIFCEACCKEIPGTKTRDRQCDGCRCGQTVGETVKELATANCTKSGNNNTSNAESKLAALTTPPKPLRLWRGSLFPEDEEDNAAALARAALTSAADIERDPATTLLVPPLQGYFELINKSDSECCCLKLLKPGNHNVVYEVPRPSYICVPPGETVHVCFDPDFDYIDLFVLFGNPHKVPASRSIVYDTTPSSADCSGGSLSSSLSGGVAVSNISPCAKTANFEEFMIYRLPCKGHNVLLKYKGRDLLEPRLGTSIARVGVFNSIGNLVGSSKSKKANQQLDMETNIKALTLICNSRN